MEPLADGPPLDPDSLPPAVGSVIDALVEAGHRTCLVGGCVRDLLRGREVAEFDVTTAAPPERVLELFPRAIPIGLRHGTLMLPSEAGPIDVTQFRAGPRLEDDLAHRDFTINAIAYDPRSGEWVDPFGGRADLAAGRLRAVGSARERFAEDPLRALRAARLAALLGFAVDPQVEAAMAEAREPLRGVARERVRRELEALLLAPHAGRGLALLRRSGLERDIASGAAADGAALVDALPGDLELRLACWLRGARAASVLRRNRFPRRSAQQVLHLLQLHPIERGAEPERDASVRRLMRRAGERDLARLFALRHAELRQGEAARAPDAPEARKRLAELEAACERVRRSADLVLRRQELAVDGRDVIEILGLPPGPEIGRALDWLTERVLDEPARNTREQLAALLHQWHARRRSP